ncbi:hypothetical protein [Stieleria sp. JC731]|nr:hypothetical protein [Stieleria sp. JC731]
MRNFIHLARGMLYIRFTNTSRDELVGTHFELKPRKTLQELS